jgi:predicted dienelactone hydrolase
MAGCWAWPARAAAPRLLPRQSNKTDQGYPLAVTDYNWLDTLRQREVPARIYYSTADLGPMPVVVFSHGLGRSLDDYAYLGQYWAGHGYVAVLVRHHGSDDAAWKGKLQPMKTLHEVYADPMTAVDRRRDLSFVLDQLDRMQVQGNRLAMRFDLQRIGLSGNDLGAQAVLVLAGQEYPGQITRPDPRIKAIVTMSPPAPQDHVSLKTVYQQINVPCMHMAGTEDDGIVGGTRAQDRRLPFENIFGADQYLITYIGADHLIYGGHVLEPLKASRDAGYQRLIRTSSTVFWNAYLKEDPQAKAWLISGGLNSLLGSEGRLEMKLMPDN